MTKIKITAGEEEARDHYNNNNLHTDSHPFWPRISSSTSSTPSDGGEKVRGSPGHANWEIRQ